ncbi:MAG: membrane protein insertion efficiency factor YidD [Crocinitomicaceae bacterium]|nr:membrane protein insertion efficiency factor YidD [Crocinitomicaceae bacterium]
MRFIFNIINWIFILPVKIYQWIISPIFPQSCRFDPTCSNYMIEAIKVWGPIKGLYLGFRRIGKCHPWGGHGHDPVPQRKKKA